MTTATYKCANKACGKDFEARTADRARGWARFCSKSCKAVKQEARTHQYRDHLLNNGQRGERLTQAEQDHEEAMSTREQRWDGHKGLFP